MAASFQQNCKCLKYNYKYMKFGMIIIPGNLSYAIIACHGESETIATTANLCNQIILRQGLFDNLTCEFKHERSFKFYCFTLQASFPFTLSKLQSEALQLAKSSTVFSFRFIHSVKRKSLVC